MTTFWKIPSTKMIFCGSIFTLMLGVIGFVVLISLSFVSMDSSVSSVEFVIAVSRHGARAPLLTYPTDPYQGPDNWPEGKGALTKKGKEQMYQIGRSLRKRYSYLFKHGYRTKDLTARSTPMARTYMSVAVLLAGMFPPEGINIWHPTIDWQPIPIFTDYDLDKSELVSEMDWCAKFTDERNRLRNESLADYFRKNRDLFLYLEEHAGITIARAVDYVRVWDPIITCDTHGFPLPSWIKAIFYPEKMNKVASDIYRLSIAGTPLMNKLFSGPLLKDFDRWISRKMDGELSERMLLHGAHDVTLIGLLSAVGFEDIPFIQPAATLLIELHRSAVYGHEVKMLYYNNSDTEEPQSLNMPKCQDPCPVSNFFDVIRQMEIEAEWEDACKM